VAWTESRIFQEWPKSVFGQGQTAAVLPAAYAGLGADSVKFALFGGNTPDRTVAITATGYNAAGSQWVVANEKTGGGSSAWVTAGRVLASKTFTTPSTGVFMFDAADLTDAAASTMSGVEGGLVFDDTITVGTGGIAKQGVCYNWFGGSQSVTAGTFSVVFNANGILRITV
jgi:hypothetical protein